jgi:uncharacterized membrane protein
MSAVVSKSRAKSMWLTGTAGLLMVAAAVVMMVVAAPRTHALRYETVTSTSHVTRDQLTSWVWVTPQHWVSVDRAPRP